MKKRNLDDLDFLGAAGIVCCALRNELQLSQDELASTTGIHRTYISDIERGKRNITVSKLGVLAAGLKTSASLIIERAEQMLVDPTKFNDNSDDSEELAS